MSDSLSGARSGEIRGSFQHNPRIDDAPFDVHGFVCRRLPDGRLAMNTPTLYRHHGSQACDVGSDSNGCSDTAITILATVIPLDDDAPNAMLRDGRFVNPVVLRLYATFRATFIRNLPDAGGTISLDTLRSWLRSQHIDGC